MDSENTNPFPMVSSWKLDHEAALTYIRDITKLLAEYSWIYRVRNTDIFMHDVLEKIPVEWIDVILELSAEDYKKLPFGFIKESWPSSLKAFIHQCTELAKLRFPKSTIQLETIKENITSTEKNMPLKKQKEIAAMSSLVYQICKDIKCQKILDIGSGLGYIDQFLHHNFGLQCVGLDYKEKKTEGAKFRLKDDPCISSMHHETLAVENTGECAEKLKVILKNVHNTDPICKCKNLNFPKDTLKGSEKAFVMIGLHCCGNLSQDMMKLFCSLNELKAFVCVGCCYNKIDLDDFPMSKAVKNVLDTLCKDYPDWYPCVSGLRLGSHATRSEIKEIEPEILLSKEKNLIYRGILQCYINQDNITWKKPKRRIRVGDLVSFEKYCDIMFPKDEKVQSDNERNDRMKKLNDIYSSKEVLFPRVRVLIILQALLQPLWESFVLLDRKLYFQEQSIMAEVCAVWDDSISPRNMALCAYKC